MSQYQGWTLLGKGGFGEVYKVVDQKTAKKYAAKVIYFDSLGDPELLKREVGIMKQHQTPTTIHIHEFIPNTRFQNKPCAIIVMSLAANGSLYDVIRKSPKGYNNTAKQIILIGISYGMAQFHSKRLLHRDLKTENILIDQRFYPHISDFGLAKAVRENETYQQSRECGTMTYMAPEIFLTEGKNYSFPVDVYSFAYILYSVITGNLTPYSHISYMTLNKIISGQHRPQLDQSRIKPCYADLIRRCWSSNQDERPEFKQIFKLLISKPFLLDGVDTKQVGEYLSYIGYLNSKSATKSSEKRPQTQQSKSSSQKSAVSTTPSKQPTQSSGQSYSKPSHNIPPNSQPSKQYSQPSQSSQQYSQPSNQYSQPYPSSQQYSQPSNQYSQPYPSSQQYSQPYPSSQQYSQPYPSSQQYSQPSNQYSQPYPSSQQYSQPSNQYSQPSQSSQQYSQPSNQYSQPYPSSQPLYEPFLIPRFGMPDSIDHS